MINQVFDAFRAVGVPKTLLAENLATEADVQSNSEGCLVNVTVTVIKSIITLFDRKDYYIQL